MLELQNLQEIHKLITALERQEPSVKADLLSFFHTNNKCQIINSHNTSSIIVIYSDVKYRCVIKVECGQDSATTREVHWYKHCALPGIVSVFVEGDVLECFSYIIMKPIDNLVSLADAVIAGEQLERVISQIDIAFKADRQLFDTTKQYRQPRAQYLDACDKFEKRMKEASRFSFLGGLINAESVKINGRVYHSPKKILRSIYSRKELIEKIFPGNVGVIHGDLHIGNMVNDKSCAGTLFVLDPGSTKPLPIQYDGGKILQSTHSGYEQVMRGYYSVTCVGRDSYRLAISNVDDFNAIYDHICREWDPTIIFGSLFMEAMHFLTMTPHHAVNQNEATALYLTGVRLLNELIDSVKSE